MHKIYQFCPSERLNVLEFNVNELAKFSSERVGNDDSIFSQMNSCLREADRQWLSTGPNKYCPCVPDRKGSRSFIDNDFKFPDTIRLTANRFSKDFVSLLVKDVRCGVVRNQIEGRWDPRKIPSLYTSFRSNKFDVTQIRPFCKREKILKTTPRVGIVADASYGMMWGDANYIPNILTLIIGSSFACQAAGFNTTAALTVGTNMNGFHLVSHPIVDDNRTVDLNKYGIYFHLDLYRGALHNASLFNEEIFKANNQGWVFYGSDGGKAVSYMRSKKADIVISIGNILDNSNADIAIENTPDLEKALNQISFELKNLYNKKAA